MELYNRPENPLLKHGACGQKTLPLDCDMEEEHLEVEAAKLELAI